MAHLVLGIGSSHSPMVSMGGDDWLRWGARDPQHTGLYTRDGRNVTYDEQLAAVGDAMVELSSAERCRLGAARVDAAMGRLRQVIGEARLDALVIVGDDQDEHLLSDNLPPFLVYHGAEIVNDDLGDLDAMPPIYRAFLPGYREPDGPQTYTVADDLARHLIATAFDRHFDVATSDRLPDQDRGMGHAFGFAMRQLVAPSVPIVPVLINTYNPPSQPRATRCRDFGRAIRAAIDSYPGDDRVGVLASGGLSHFLVLEDLDQEVIAALERDDVDALCAIPEATYVAGTSEIKNWIATAAACHGFHFELVDYVPGYRSPAGSGTGLAFATWTP